MTTGSPDYTLIAQRFPEVVSFTSGLYYACTIITKSRCMWSEEYTVQLCTSKVSSDSQRRLRRLLEADLAFKRNRIMQPPSKELPRLSSALRAFGGVSSHLSRETVWFDETLLKRKQKRKKEASSGEKTWKQVAEIIATQCIKQNETKARMHGVLTLENVNDILLPVVLPGTD